MRIRPRRREARLWLRLARDPGGGGFSLQMNIISKRQDAKRSGGSQQVRCGDAWKVWRHHRPQAHLLSNVNPMMDHVGLCLIREQYLIQRSLGFLQSAKFL